MDENPVSAKNIFLSVTKNGTPINNLDFREDMSMALGMLGKSFSAGTISMQTLMESAVAPLAKLLGIAATRSQEVSSGAAVEESAYLRKAEDLLIEAFRFGFDRLLRGMFNTIKPSSVSNRGEPRRTVSPVMSSEKRARLVLAIVRGSFLRVSHFQSQNPALRFTDLIINGGQESQR